MIPHYELHELALIFPPFNQEEYDKLKADIQENGIHIPIVLFDHKILDGRHRYQACLELGIEPKFEQFEGENALDYVLGVNMNRRTLSSTQKACIGLEYLEIEQERAKQRQIEAGKATGKDKSDKDVKNASQASERAPTARKIVADKVGTNEAYLQIVKKIHTIAPELFEQMKTGTMEQATAKQFTDLKEQDPALYSQAISHFQKFSKYKARDCINAVRNKALAETNKDLTFPSGKKYRVLYADPPWHYGDTTNPNVSSPADRYQTSPTSEICDIKMKDDRGREFAVKEVMAQNSVLFMWTSSPHLEQAFSVIKAWGFEYKTTFIWHKIKHNMGHYNSVRHEILMVATRGSCTPDKLNFISEEEVEKRRLYPSVFPSDHLKAETFAMEPESYGENSVYEETRGEHSKKPKYYYELIERLYKNGPYLEMYCRSPQPGWDFYGNQAVIQKTGNKTKNPKP